MEIDDYAKALEELAGARILASASEEAYLRDPESGAAVKALELSTSQLADRLAVAEELRP